MNGCCVAIILAPIVFIILAFRSYDKDLRDEAYDYNKSRRGYRED